MHARSKMATGSHMMRINCGSLCHAVFRDRDVIIVFYCRNPNFKTLSVKVILHYLLFIYLCHITA